MDTNVIYCTSCGAANVAGARFCAKCGAPIQAAEPSAPASRPSDFITLSCPNCGGKLEITPDMERFSCKYCGHEHLVRRTGGVVSLAPVVEGLKRVETKFDQVLSGSDRLAAEQTIQRLKTEIPELEKRVAEKELALKRLTPHPTMRGISISLMIFGATLLLMFLINPGNEDYFSPIVWWAICGGFFGIMSIIAGLTMLVSATGGKKDAIEKVKAELTQLQADLQNRRQQLEQLHHYTAER